MKNNDLEMLVGLEITNDEEYQLYREKMTPILSEYGGSFGYDFKIGETLKSESNHAINRVFTIRFPDEDTMDRFFSHPEYQKIKEQHFTSSVKNTTIIAKYDPH